MKATFDSNAYRPATDPEFFANDPRLEDFRTVHAAIVDGRVEPFLSETVVTLESIRNTERGAFFAGAKANVDVQEQETSGGDINLTFTIGPRKDLHPGVPLAAQRWLDQALALGFRFMRAPRLGQPKPPYLERPGIYGADADIGARQDLFHQVGRDVEKRGVGQAVAKAVGVTINTRLGSAEPWFAHLNETKDAHEEAEMRRAIGEWADGDTAAAHVGYGNDVLCTEDQGNSATASVFDAANRRWLEATHGVNLATLSELAAMLRTGRA